MQTEETINNAFYNDLGDRWYVAQDDPVALLRAESRLHNTWINERIGAEPRRVLDIACGAGFLANSLARHGHEVTGVDAAPGALEVARRHDKTGTVRYLTADALRLPFENQTFDAVTMMDFLEHVDRPALFVKEAARVLKPGGLYIFHTFNRNWLAHLIAIRGVEWFVRNTPPKMHIISMFIRPDELTAMCRDSGLEVSELIGSRPVVASRAFWKMLATGSVPDDFQFRFTRSLALSYLGCAKKTGA